MFHLNRSLIIITALVALFAISTARAQDDASGGSGSNSAGDSGSGSNGGGSVSGALTDAMNKMNAFTQCNSSCDSDSLSCMGACPNGRQGAHCRGSCMITHSSCQLQCQNANH